MYYVIKCERDVCPICGLVSDVYTRGRGEGKNDGCDHSVYAANAPAALLYRPANVVPLNRAREDRVLEPFATYPAIPATTTPKFGKPERVEG
jgi:hypothetical protein